jgi:hypothetical protein
MTELYHFDATDHLVHDRIHDLYATASELRAERRRPSPDGPSGLVARTRFSLGRRIVAFGSAIAGQRA